MKKTLVVLLVVLALLCCFVGCSKKAEVASAEEAKVEEPKSLLGSAPVTIKVWHCCSEEDGKQMQKMVDEFNANNGKQITVEATFQGQYSDAKTLMMAIVAAGNYSELPDMMQLDATGKSAYLESGKAFTIDDAVKAFNDDIKSEYLQGALGNWQFKGIQLGLPFATSTTVTFYNKDILKKAGWDHCPDTFADVIQLAKDMKAAGLTDYVTYQDVPNTPSLANWLGQLGSYMLNFSNGSEANGTKLDCVENGALETFLTEWKKMYDAGALVNNSASKSDFIAGKVAVFTNSTSNITSILNKVGGAFEVGTSTFLRVNDKASYGATLSGSCMAMFDSGDQLKKEATWEFLKYITNAENQALFGAATGYTPANAKSADTAIFKEYIESHPQAKIITEQLAKTPANMRSAAPHSSVNADFYYGIMNGVQKMLKENQAPATAAKAIADTLQGLLDKAARIAE